MTREITEGKVVHVLVANAGMRAVTIPPHSKLASVTTVAPTVDLGLVEKSNGIHVFVNRVLLQSATDTDCKILVGEDVEEKVKIPEQETYVFDGGSQYTLPPGLDLSSCLLDGEDKDDVVRLIQKHDSVFSKDQFDVGSCDKV